MSSGMIPVYGDRNKHVEKWACPKCEGIAIADHADGPPDGACQCSKIHSGAASEKYRKGYDLIDWNITWPLKLGEVLDGSDIVDVISEHIELKRDGRNYKAQCPFCLSTQRSFIVNHSKQLFHCFSCGRGGMVFVFVMLYQNCSFSIAVDRLAKRIIRQRTHESQDS